MKQKCSIILLLSAILLLATFSCQKNQIEDINSVKQEMGAKSVEKQVLTDWLDLHTRNLKDPEKKIFEEIT